MIASPSQLEDLKALLKYGCEKKEKEMHNFGKLILPTIG
jgi:hypothetical protein